MHQINQPISQPINQFTKQPFNHPYQSTTTNKQTKQQTNHNQPTYQPTTANIHTNHNQPIDQPQPTNHIKPTDQPQPTNLPTTTNQPATQQINQAYSSQRVSHSSIHTLSIHPAMLSTCQSAIQSVPIPTERTGIDCNINFNRKYLSGVTGVWLCAACPAVWMGNTRPQ